MSRGAKPQQKNNVVALLQQEEPQAAHYALAEKLKPIDLTEKESAVWDRVAPQLALLQRLKPHYVDALQEYCIIRVRLSEARKTLDDEQWTYVVSGRNGDQQKSRPEVAQLNDDWRKWRSLVGEFGLAPAAERGLLSGQGDLISDGFSDF